MKHAALALSAALLFTGCSAQAPGDHADMLQQRYAEADEFSAQVEIAVARTDETLHYTLDVGHTAAETRLTVVAPEMLAGVGVTVSEEDWRLSYDGVVLDAGSADPAIGAVNATDIVWRAIADGWITERGTERLDGVETLRLCFETEQNAKTLCVAVWFDDSDAPLYAEIEEKGEILVELRFTDFAFRDKMEGSSVTKRDGNDGNAPQTDVGGDRPGQSGT